MIGEPLSFCGATDPGGGRRRRRSEGRRATSGRLDHVTQTNAAAARLAPSINRTTPHGVAQWPTRARPRNEAPRAHSEPCDATRLALDRRWAIRARPSELKKRARASFRRTRLALDHLDHPRVRHEISLVRRAEHALLVRAWHM